MDNRILLIGTGGTIGSVRGDNIHLDEPFKILDYVSFDNVEFECVSPFAILSENMDFEHWQILLDYIGKVDFDTFKGVIILHGSDTLSFTGALVANAFGSKPVVLVASDKPLEDKSANGFKNFENAVNVLLSGTDRVCISYDGVFYPEENALAENAVLNRKNILVITPYVNINYDNYNIDSVDAVLHTMYHSATAPKNVEEFADRCRAAGVEFYFVTENSSADYESAKNLKNIIFNSTLESAYAKLLLTK